MGTVRFILRADKPANNGAFPIQLLYQLSGVRKYFQTKESLRPENWDAKEQKAVYLDKAAAKKILPDVRHSELPHLKNLEELNARLSALTKQVNDIETLYELNGTPYSAEMVIRALKETQKVKTKKEAPSNQLFDFIDNYIAENKVTREPGSLEVYKSLKTHLQDFQTEKKRKVTFDAIDYSFFLEFQSFLLTPRKVFILSKKKDGTGEGRWKTISLNNTTVAKQLSTIKTFLNYAKLRGVTVPGNYSDFKIKKETLEVIALTNEEFETLYNLDLSEKKRLDQVRDVFCFACSTGMRYSDLSQLKREHIKKEEIRFTVKKTKEPQVIPLNPYSYAILSKYSQLHKPLPVISNQKTNEAIKELCQLAQINEPVEIVRYRGSKREANTYPKYELISIHTGRKTFCTLSLEKGMNAEEVMQISGHKDYKSFKRYVKITEQRTKVVMKNAWGEVKANNLKAV